MSEAVRRLAVVNALRGAAILSVIHYHMSGMHVPPGSATPTILGLPLAVPLAHGWLGVDLFFVLSGFVLYLPYAAGERRFANRDDLWAYYRRRFLRLMPLYYFSLIVALAFVYQPDPTSAQFWWDALAMATASFPAFERLFFPPYNWVLWSLGVEIWFSLLLPMLVIAARRIGIGALLGISLGLSLLVRILGNELCADFPNPYLNPVKDSVGGRLDEFVLGMAICSIYLERGRRSWRAATPSILVGLTGLFAVCWLWDQVRVGSVTRAAVPFINLALLLGFSGLVWGTLSLPAGRWRSALTWGPLQVVGMMCYSLYVWHGIVLRNWFDGPADWYALRIAVYFSVLLAFSALTYRYVEFGHRRDWRSLFRGAKD